MADKDSIADKLNNTAPNDNMLSEDETIQKRLTAKFDEILKVFSENIRDKAVANYSQQCSVSALAASVDYTNAAMTILSDALIPQMREIDMTYTENIGALHGEILKLSKRVESLEAKLGVDTSSK